MMHSSIARQDDPIHPWTRVLLEPAVSPVSGIECVCYLRLMTSALMPSFSSALAASSA